MRRPAAVDAVRRNGAVLKLAEIELRKTVFRALTYRSYPTSQAASARPARNEGSYNVILV
jgi:hypothetical protein